MEVRDWKFLSEMHSVLFDRLCHPPWASSSRICSAALSAQAHRHRVVGIAATATRSRFFALPQQSLRWRNAGDGRNAEGARTISCCALPRRGRKGPSSGGKREQRWWMRFEELEDYKETYGDCNVPRDWIDNPPLANWVHKQRQLYMKGKLDPEREQWLTWLGFSWQPHEENWDKMFQLLILYKGAHDGDCDVPEGYEVEGAKKNYKLGSWVHDQRTCRKEGKMDGERERRLEDLGLKWECRDEDWEENFLLLSEYEESHGHCNVPRDYEVEDTKLGNWVNWQRQRHKEGQMHQDQERRLRELGFSFQPLIEKWEERFRLLVEYKEAHGHCNVPVKYEVKGIKLGNWVQWQRTRHKKGKMHQDQERRLRELGFSFQ